MIKIINFIAISIFLSSCSSKKQPYFNTPWGYVEVKDSSKKEESSQAVKKTVTKKVVKKTNTKKQIKSTKKSSKSTKKSTQKNESLIVIAARNAGSDSYKIAGKICEHINKTKNSQIRCVVEPVSSVKYAFENDKKYDFVISKTSIDAFNKSNKNIKSIFSLYPETITIITSKKSGINSVSDLNGKKIFMASKGDELKIALNRMLAMYGLSNKNVEFVQGFNMGNALCENEIDAIMVDVNHPSSDINEFVYTCGAKILNLDENIVSTLVKQNEEYVRYDIEDFYGKKQKTVKSFGTMVNFVATSKPSDETVYKVTKMIFDDLQKFKISDKILLDLTKQEMASPKKGLVFETHKGAARYYKEVGIKK